jgi:hypothetical protein
VIPAKAEIHQSAARVVGKWIPAFAGHCGFSDVVQ